MADYYVREEDGTSKYVLEDSSGDYLLETSPAEVDPSFIASATVVYTPTVGAVDVDPSFISSVTAVYTPTLHALSLVAPFISSVTTVHPPRLPFEPSISVDARFAAPAFGWAYFGAAAGGPETLMPVPFIGSVTAVYTPIVQAAAVAAPFISSATVVYTPGAGISGDITVTVPGTYAWVCPSGVTQVHVKCYGGGGGAGSSQHLGLPFVDGGGGAGGGAFAERLTIPVTPGSSYTFVVGAAGAGGTQGVAGTDGGSSTFTGDSGVQVIAVGGHHGFNDTKGTGGAAGSSTGDGGHVFSGGDGGAGSLAPSGGGAGGGASGNGVATGSNGTDSPGTGAGAAGGTGANGGGSGGSGGANGVDGSAGSIPGGGGGAGGWNTGHAGIGGNGGAGEVSIAVVVTPITPSFIASVTVVYAIAEIAATLPIPFIGSVTVVYTPDLPEVNAPFIASRTRVYRIFSFFDPNLTFGGPGNGGEGFLIRLAPNGATETATLLTTISATELTLSVTGDGGLPATKPFVVTIDSEVMLVFQTAPGNYRIRLRAISNTTASSHTAGASVVWGDSYEMAITAGAKIANSFTADIESTGSFLYPGWLVCYDSTQAYDDTGARYPMHVTEMLGVFDAGTGSSGTSRCDGVQPSAIHTPTGTSDDCPVALTNPARIATDIEIGDVAVVRYTNPEATVLDLGGRSTALQSWFGMKRVDTSDNDVTFTDPNGIVVDTTGTYDTFTGSVNDEFLNPSSIGIGPDTGTPTPNAVPYTTVTLPGTDRFFTYGPPHYSERGWPFGALAVRQGNRRVPFWQSYDWHNFSYVYDGFGTDCTFAQIVVNRNGVSGSEPEVVLPGPQDIAGPDAVWDDGTYYFGVSWYVAIFSGPYLVIGPAIGGTGPGGPGGGGDPPAYIPGVTFPPVGPPVITPPEPPPVEGGSGGGIDQPLSGLHVWGTSGKGFS